MASLHSSTGRYSKYSAVEVATLKMLADLALVGVGEKEQAHGLTVLVADVKKLLETTDDDGDPFYGSITNDMFDWRARNLNVLNLTRETMQMVKTAAKEDGALLIDEATGQIMGASFFVCVSA